MKASDLHIVFSFTETQKALDFNSFIDKLNKAGAGRVVFFCIEEKPEAYHRSIVTHKLEKLGYKITHL